MAPPLLGRNKIETFEFVPVDIMGAGYFGLEIPKPTSTEPAPAVALRGPPPPNPRDTDTQVFNEVLVGDLFQNEKRCSAMFKICSTSNRITSGNNHIIKFGLTVTLGKHKSVTGMGLLHAVGSSLPIGSEYYMDKCEGFGKYAAKYVTIKLKLESPSKGTVTVTSTWM